LTELKKNYIRAKTRFFKKNQIIHYEGDHATGIYLVISGKVKTMKMAEDGRELMTGIYQAEDFLGINTILLIMNTTCNHTRRQLFVFFSKTQFDEMCDCIRMLQEIS
jgi:CRP-like cAMP-binding protein